MSGDDDVVAIMNFNTFANNVTATPTSLQFNFNGNGGFMNFYKNGPCLPEWSFETTESACNGATGNEEGVSAVDPIGTGTYSSESGEVTFATVVPEASTYGLTLIALGLLVLGRRGFPEQLA